jgi:hypothetical protein
MLQQATATDQILAVVNAHPDCTLDELTQRLQGLAWSDIFLEVDRLSRTGQLVLTHSGIGFITTLRVP